MQAPSSSKAAGTWSRTEQFAALRYVSQHLREDLDRDPAEAGRTKSEPEPWTAQRLAGDAGQLLQAMRLCNDRVADVRISSVDRDQTLAELKSLKDKSWELMESFWRMADLERSSQSAEKTGSKVMEQGAAGWIAC